MKTDTIAAIATAMSNSGIGIVRISGDEALEVADRIFRPKKGSRKVSDMETHTIHYGYVVDGEEVVDEVMLLIMKAPRSYTCEDTIEIDCHGGVLVMKKILETVLKYGARPAEPGEFTKRAFLNGRIDLSQAESVIDVINAQNELALKSSVSQLQGAVLEKIKDIRAVVLHEIAFIESALDDPEHVSLDGYPEQLRGIMSDAHSKVKKLLDSSDNGKMLKEGINTAIVGKPNAGKSSLLNILVVWMLTGFWHGAAWNFVVWGLMFAVLLIMEKLWLLKPLSKCRPLAHLYVVFFVVISFVIFNAENMGQALSDIGGLFGAGGIPLVSAEAVYCLRSFALVLILAVLGATPLLRNGLVRLSQYPTAGKVLNALEPFTLFVLLLVMTGYLVDGSFNPFLYFRF